MKRESSWDSDADYIEERAGYLARLLISAPGYTSSDIDDLEQEIIIGIWLRLPKYDPTKASRKTFIARISENLASELAKKMTLSKWDVRKEKYSLDKPGDGDSGDGATRSDPVSVEENDARLWGKFLTRHEQMILEIDIQAIYPQLDDEQRQICELLSQGTPAAGVAKSMGMARSTLYKRIEELRMRFRKNGYG